MKMTKTYAATIAAVAPIIWIVATVEMHDFFKRYERLVRTHAPLGQARRLAEQVNGRATSEQLAAISSLIHEALSVGMDVMQASEAREEENG
ncbi:hypothetical protein ACQEV9_14530 [Streptomyces chartreusis]|uniref:hypothetical protein n=1 Tax=Streptomyces chartreusis TaxID=1969 RepID=UPI003D89DAF9